MKKRYEQPEIVFGNYAADIVMASVGMPESLGDGDWGVNDDVFEGKF